ncbi:MAG: cyclic pyranopterin monophosphate synthase MoaC, partial [Candidatus Omnitrophica bacterium]|nr:cyclic pyranopterin monophosphate synthase MoaC [Candidatus Omnitrophota bacterium]
MVASAKCDLRMIDISAKKETRRLARAEGYVVTSSKVIKTIKEGRVIKGDVFSAAQIAGIMAAKNVPGLIPLCHPLLLTQVDVKIKIIAEDTIRVESMVSNLGRTGPDVEAMVAVSAACLAVYDMCKSLDR